MREALLIKQARNGDRAAFDCLIAPYVKPLFSYISSRVNNYADANDIIQECMLSIWQSMGSYGYQSSFKTWVYSIARRRIADFYRKSSKHISVPLSNIENDFAARDSLNERIESIDIDNALSCLDSADNELVYLVFRAQLSYQEVSAVLGIPVGTVKSRMSRIKAKLKLVLS